VIKPGTVHDRRSGGSRPRRIEILSSLLQVLPDSAAIIATTGKCGRELFTLADREQHLYVVGSMGCASAIGLGAAVHVKNPIVVLDGDGAALMKMGNLATIGTYAPSNLIHVLLDNGVHDSTGGQQTVSANVDFATIAAACGYVSATQCDDGPGFEQVISASLRAPGPHFIRVLIRPGSIEKLGRPTVTPIEFGERFRSFLTRASRIERSAA
jgi:phosphonopyruvate decarboxylase